MHRVAIVEYTMSAGGVERVLRGLARVFLDLPEARDWDITFLLSRYNSAHRRCEWPFDLTGPNVHVEWLGEETALGRLLDPLAHGQGLWGLPLSKMGGLVGTRLLRRLGPLSWRARLGDPYALIKEATRRFDLLYFTYPVLLEAPPAGVPVIITPQDFNYRHFLPEDDPTRRQHERATRGWLARSSRILLSTGAVRDELRRFYPEFDARAQVVHLGVDASEPPPDPGAVADVRARHRLPASFALCAGWVLPHKNQLALVQAAVKLRERGLHLPIVFVGPNATSILRARETGFREEYPARVRSALDEAGLEHGRDYFALGYVTDAEIRCLYRLASVFVLPSLYEGFGLPSLEALLAGCPTILSAIPPLEEQNRVLGGGLPTFDPLDPGALADRLEWILTHGDEARATARLVGERVALEYDWRKTARAYLAAFEEVISSAGKLR
jgi:glycosyltransferase involved in cell wall biosynthesis